MILNVLSKGTKSLRFNVFHNIYTILKSEHNQFQYFYYMSCKFDVFRTAEHKHLNFETSPFFTNSQTATDYRRHARQTTAKHKHRRTCTKHVGD